MKEENAKKNRINKKFPNFEEEKKLCKKGFQIVVGVDEVGRGPLAGPVVAAAVTLRNFKFEILNFKSNPNYKILKKIKDSKKLSGKNREEIFNAIKNCPDFVFGIGEVSEKVIDKINILNATKLAMQKAIENLKSKISGGPTPVSFFILVDGNMRFEKDWFGENVGYKSIVKGDQKVFSISVASIIAKVYRDRLMEKYAKKYPQYGFEKHKGYGTKKHFEALEKFGVCKIHRKTFLPG